MSAEFPKNETAPASVETRANKIARLRAELAALEAEEAAESSSAERPVETEVTTVQSSNEQQAADTAALAATRERLGIVEPENNDEEEYEKQLKTTEILNWFNRANVGDARYKALAQAYGELPPDLKKNAERDRIASELKSLKEELIAIEKAKQGIS